MNSSIKTGLTFGLTSGIITTLGLMVGLNSGTHSKFAVLGGILTIAIADSFSDALGIHISEEAENVHTEKEIWMATIVTLFSKMLFALTFVIPVIFLDLKTAIIASIIWSIIVLTVLSYFIARDQGNSSARVIFEHLLIMVVVISLTHWIGDMISGICMLE